MSNLFDVSRRDLLKTLGSAMVMSTAGAGVLTPLLAQHVHEAVGEVKSLNTNGEYTPKFFTAHEYKTMRRLSDLIIPADEHSKGALDGGAPEFIDFLCSRSDEMAEIYTGGIGWMDEYMQRHHGATWVEAKPEQQTMLLDQIAFKKNASPELNPGIRFFTWARNMTADAFYTSPVGFADLGFMGNGAMSSFSVPREAVEYAMKRSPFANEA